jgi:hypothetical protein
MSKNRKKRLSKKSPGQEVHDYDFQEAGSFIDAQKPLKFEDLGLRLPERPPTEVVSIRLPTVLLNQLRSLGSQKDIPYQALIKLFLSESIKRMKELPR